MIWSQEAKTLGGLAPAKRVYKKLATLTRALSDSGKKECPGAVGLRGSHHSCVGS